MNYNIDKQHTTLSKANEKGMYFKGKIEHSTSRKKKKEHRISYPLNCFRTFLSPLSITLANLLRTS